MLQIKKLTKKFGGVKAVDNCSTSIKENMITAIIGPNGSGKTTLFNLISGTLKENNGRIVFNGEDITHYSPDKVSNAGIARIFQQSSLFWNLTVRENLLIAINQDDTKFWKNLLGLTKYSKDQYKEVKSALSLIGMFEHQNKIVKNLSYGQQRLVEIARSLVNPHKLLMLDEPVAGVNPLIRKNISNLLLDLKKKGETIVLIEHDMDFVLNIVDHVIVMDEGKIIAEGSPNKIKNNSKVLEAYLGD
ncbi:ATP-binding cassette domain-containing protein [Candidatus Woesearchaeota archaeon]|nr:ATP-binding cassette domain-containing protein [Candidatus Woesearchaeota archaeon]